MPASRDVRLSRTPRMRASSAAAGLTTELVLLGTAGAPMRWRVAVFWALPLSGVVRMAAAVRMLAAMLRPGSWSRPAGGPAAGPGEEP